MSIDAEAFFAAFEEAWQLRDVDAIAGFFAVPQLIVSHGTSHFFESAEALRGHFAQIAARYEEAGVAAIVRTGLRAEQLPDDALRATVHWRLDRADGTRIIDFDLVYTLAWDTEAPDAVPIAMAVDVSGEVAAWKALQPIATPTSVRPELVEGRGGQGGAATSFDKLRTNGC